MAEMIRTFLKILRLEIFGPCGKWYKDPFELVKCSYIRPCKNCRP